MFRFSLRWLLVIVSLFCFGLAALRNPTEPMMLAVAAVLVSSTAVGIVFAAARRSAFGAAYAGGALTLVLLTSPAFAVGTYPSDQLIQKVAGYFLSPWEASATSDELDRFSPLNEHNAGLALRDLSRPWRFREIVRGLLAVGSGLIAGAFARFLAPRSVSKCAPHACRREKRPGVRFVVVFTLVAILGGLALFAGSELSVAIVLAATAGILLVAAIRAIAFGRDVPVSLGTALVGGTYLALSILTLAGNSHDVRMPTEVVTSHVLAEMYDNHIEALSWRGLQRDQLPPLHYHSLHRNYAINVHRIALLLWSLAIGLVGGLAVAVVRERDQRAS